MRVVWAPAADAGRSTAIESRTMNPMATEEAKRERPTNGVWYGVFMGLGLRPLEWVLHYFFSGSVAFALALLSLMLLAYPLFLKGRPWPWSWQRNRRFRQYTAMAVALSVVVFILARFVRANW
jgi:hypothetical protein